MYESGQEEEYDQFRYQAKLFGIDLDKAKEEIDYEKAMPSDPLKEPRIEEEQSLPIFKDPSEYEHMSEEERKELTQKMMGKHQAWVAQSAVGAGATKARTPRS